MSRSYLLIDRGNAIKILPTANLSVIEVDAGKSEISINQVREFKEWAWRKPFLGKQKIGVIQRAQKMSPEAQNALLKVLEEPPLSTSIVLLADDAANLLPTVVSRCLPIDNLDEVEGWNKEKSKIKDHPSFAKATEGVPRSFNEVGQKSKNEKQRAKSERINLPVITSIPQAFKQAEDLARKKSREEVIELLDDWIKTLRSQLIHSDQAIQVSFTKQLREMLKTKKFLLNNVNVRLALENLFLKMFDTREIQMTKPK